MKNTFKAFTLAEILVAMLMFGILAVMLIPKVTNNAERELFTTQTKKVQNDIQQALLIIISQKGGSLKGACSGISQECLLKEISNRLEHHTLFKNTDVQADCNFNSKAKISDTAAQACNYQQKNPITLNNTAFAPNAHIDNNTFYALNLKNGATISLVFDSTCAGGFINQDSENAIKNVNSGGVLNSVLNKLCGYMEVDVNASKVPNMIGKDIHYFWITASDGIVPFGEFGEFQCGTVNNTTYALTTLPKKDTEINHQLGCTYRMLSKPKVDFY